MDKKLRRAMRERQNAINAQQGYNRVRTWRDIEADKKRKAQEEAIAKRMQEKANMILDKASSSKNAKGDHSNPTKAGFFSGYSVKDMAGDVVMEMTMEITPEGVKVLRPRNTLDGECVEVSNEPTN